MLKNLGIKISMDGKDRWTDNIYIEWLWRTIKYKLFYLYHFKSVQEDSIAIAKFIKFYNTERPRQSLEYEVPKFVHNQRLKSK